MKIYIKSTTTPDFQNLYDFSSFHMKIQDESSIWVDYKQPIKSSLCKKLNSKPINQLSLEDIAVLYTMYWTWFTYQTYDGDFVRALSDCWERYEDDFRNCYEWLHSLTFPLKIYRAVTDAQESAYDISGSARAWSWTTDVNLYSASNSIFRNVKNVYSAEVDAGTVSNIDTVHHYVLYSSRPDYGRYPESEITLKKRYKMSELHNLEKIK